MARILKIKPYDVANGPGIRVSIWFAGCRLACEGCFSRDTWNFKCGKEFSQDTINEVLEALKDEHIQGLSILGGNPTETESIEDVHLLTSSVKEHFGQSKDIWIWSGYTLKELEDNSNIRYLEHVDCVIDGRFSLAEKDLTLKWRGSSNQKVWKKDKSNTFFALQNIL